MIQAGSCINPENAQIQGTNIFDETKQTYEVIFKELSTLKMFFTYNIFDASDPVSPLKTRIATTFIDKVAATH